MGARRRSWCGVSIVLTIGLCGAANVALADPASVAPEAPAPAQPRPFEWPAWTLGVGLRFGGVAAGLGNDGAFVSPGGAIFVERRIVGPLSAIGRIQLAFDYSTVHDPLMALPGHLTDTATSVLGALGLRIAFTTPKVLGVSMFAVVEGAYSHATSTAGFDALSRSVGGALGLTLDREIVSGFGLRASSTILETRYSANKLVGPGAPGQVATEISAAVELAPELQLRWSF